MPRTGKYLSVIWVLPAFIGGLLAQSSVLPTWLQPRVIPDFVLILVVLYGGLLGWQKGLLAGLLGTVMESLVSTAPLGVHLVRLGVVGLGAGLSGSRFERTGLLVPPVLVAMGTVVGAVLTVLSLQVIGWVVALTPPAAADVVLQAALNALVSLAVLPLLRRSLKLH